jgi:predicted DNA-binding protein
MGDRLANIEKPSRIPWDVMQRFDIIAEWDHRTRAGELLHIVEILEHRPDDSFLLLPSESYRDWLNEHSRVTGKPRDQIVNEILEQHFEQSRYEDNKAERL